MEFRVLGPLEATQDGRAVALGGPKQRAVLAVLLMNDGRVVDRNRLIDEVWGDDPPATAGKTLQVYVSNLRKAIGDGLLVTHGRGYSLELPDGALDLQRFERLTNEGRRRLAEGNQEPAAEALHEALSLWRGAPLADVADQGLLASDVARLEDLHVAAIEDRIDAELALGAHTALAPELARLVREHPLRERLRAQLMLALYRSGRQAEALEAYRDARAALVEELGIEPGRELQGLHDAILNQAPELELPAAQRQPPAAPAGTAPPPAGPAAQPRAPSRPPWRRLALAGGLLTVVAVAVALALALGGDSESGVAPVKPDSVAVIDPGSDRVTGSVDVGSTPTVVASRADGVWVLNANEETVTRIDPRTRTAERTIGTRGTPTDLTVSPAAVWVANRPSELVRIDAGTGTLVRRVEVPLAERQPRFSTPVSAYVAASPDAVWMSANATVARVDTASTRLVLRRAIALSAGQIAIGEGAVWVGGLSRLDPATGRLTGSVKVPFEPADVAAGQGSVWLANGESDTVWAVDPRALTVRRTIKVGAQPVALALGERALWVASQDGTVSRIDPRTSRVEATIETGGTPRGIAVGHGRVWVAIS